MSSILTNNGAMVALQTLKGINANMARTQNEISTGKSVATAKDNAAVWAIAKTMETDVASFKGIRDSLSMGQATVGVAREAAESITELLKEIKVKVVASQEDNVDKEKIQTDITALRDQIATVVGAAQFNGLNMLNGEAENPVKVLASLDRASTGAVTASHIDVATVDLTTGGDLAALADIDVTADNGATAALGAIDALIATAIDAAASFGSAQKRIEIQASFVGKLSDAMTSGIGAMVDADMEEVSARLQALQVQQQLATQSLSIANQAPQNILQLFR
ncbi:MAG: flagellin [Paracoccus sp. (in: a-proteobacteria)]|nr:flagellin [Paracoccus sp. (in: a-proteobacteria)]